MAKGVLGGIAPDPDKGKPFKHTRAKARLLLADATFEHLRSAMADLIEKNPALVLDSLCDAMNPDKEENAS